jgi:[acyl-carrier-protein] S-malonyltransferase
MKGIVFLFDGQGAFKPGVGRELYGKYPPAQKVIDRSSEILGFDLKDHLWGAAAAATSGRTSVAQPAIAVVSQAYAEVLKEMGVTAEVALGHSLGEASALAYCGALSFDDGIRMIQMRGKLMEKGGKEGGMMAVVNVELPILDQECKKISGAINQALVVANINAPGQIVVSGSKDGLKQLTAFVSQNHGRSIPLDVGGAWHSPFLKEASEEFSQFLDKLNFVKPPVKFYSVVEEKILDDARTIRDAFKKQMLARVNWVQAIENLKSMGYGQFLEIGPGKILKDLVVKIASDIKVDTVAVYTDLQILVQVFK